jgi:hypothetical protein
MRVLKLFRSRARRFPQLKTRQETLPTRLAALCTGSCVLHNSRSRRTFVTSRLYVYTAPRSYMRIGLKLAPTPLVTSLWSVQKTMATRSHFIETLLNHRRHENFHLEEFYDLVITRYDRGNDRKTAITDDSELTQCELSLPGCHQSLVTPPFQIQTPSRLYGSRVSQTLPRS